MRRVLLIMVLAVVCLTTHAQTQLSDTQSQEVMNQLTQAAASMQTMQCRFVQEKTSTMLAEPSVSEGLMYFVASDKMRWEYTSPYAFALVVNGERIVKVTEGKTEVLEGNSSRMYQGIVSIIMGSASGKKLFDTSAFDIMLCDDDAFWKAEMTPKRRDMKRMFSQLVFRFDKKTNGISRVEFIGSDGDVTSIRFEEIKLNEMIGEDKFQ
ncbi:MAG: outer membrane lipoprotein carrier protein LolA [Bacteroidales bacterium]|nr:outer membrane lipoprotein carrier protein LolA [Bacteroidales bacterium]